MRKFTILAVAALAAVTTAMAQPKVLKKKAPKAELAKAPQRQAIKLADVNLDAAQQQKPGQMTFAKVRRNEAKHANANNVMRARKKANAPRKADIIYDQPEGTLHSMVYASNSYAYNWLIGYYSQSYTDRLGQVVEGTDGCIYIHNLIADLSTENGYWVKAERAQGDTIVIHEQPIWDEVYDGEVYTHSITKASVVDGKISVPQNTDIKMIWKDGVLSTIDEYNNPVDDMSTVITAFDNEGYWCGAMTWNVSMKPQTDVAITQLPEGAQPQELVMKYRDNNDQLAAAKVQMAISGNEAYLQYYDGLDSWIKGTVNGNKVTFPTRQYLGADENYGSHVYFMAVPADDDYFETLVDEVTFDYDPANMTLNNTENWIFANGGKETIYYIEAYLNPYIFKFNEVPATPTTPEITYFYQYNPNYGYGYIDFTANYFDAEENYLDPEKMYYKLYVDDKEFVLDPYEYSEVEEPTSEIPYTLSDWSIYASGNNREVEFFFNVQKNIGVQMFYTGGGEVHSTDIVWYEVDGGAVTGEEGFMALVEEGEANMPLNEGEMAVNLGAVAYGFNAGTPDDETYDVAYHLVDPTLAGAQITAINVPFIKLDGISNTKVWLASELGIQEGKFQANIVTKEFEANRGFTQVVLDTPYTIPESGVYVGYSFDQKYMPELKDQPTPVMLTNYTTEGGFLIHTNWAYRQGWTSMYGNQGDLAMELVVKGGNIKANDAWFYAINEVYAKTGEPSQADAYIINYGYNGVSSIDYEYAIGDQSGTTHAELNPAVGAVYGNLHAMTIDIPAMPQKGSYDYMAKITKVNAESNASESWMERATVNVLNVLPKKRPMLEEYTGTWCGWCPRGWVALEKMNKLYPEDFVALSYHNEDPMEYTYYFPNDVQGYPDAWVDRYYQTDAYLGDNDDYSWGFEDVWKRLSKNFGVADLNITAEWDETQEHINITTVANFPMAEEKANYGLAYALVADGLTGTGDDWAQSNYYANDLSWPVADFRQFIVGGAHVSGLVFNDVTCGVSGYEGIEGSIPANIAEDASYGHSYQFNIADTYNTAGEPIIQDKNKVRAIVMLIDNNTGRVLNSNKCNVLPAGTGIANTQANGQVESVAYYDLSGRKVLMPNGGVYIKSVKYKNGQTDNQKVLVK